MDDKITPFYVMEVMAAAQEREMAGEQVWHLEVGQPSTGAPRAAVQVAHKLLDSSALGYTPSKGIPELAPAIATHIRKKYTIDVDPGRIAITSGASGAMVLAVLAAFKPGDRIGISEPGYPCYRNILLALGLEPVPIKVGPESRFQPRVEHLAAGPQIDGLVVASPSNPTGTVLSPAELGTIVAWCGDNNVQLISDEIYHGLTYGDVETATAAQFSDDVIVINSFSKYWSMTGWRMGWMVLPERLVSAVDRRAQNLVICPPAISQHVALAALDCADELEGHLRRYDTNRQILLAGLPDVGLTEIAPTDGAFYLWARCDHLGSSVDIAAQWLDAWGVAVTPGIDFDPVDGHRYLRFSYSGSTETVRQAVAQLQRWSDSSV